MIKWILFGVGSIGLLYVSRASLWSPHSHGFYRLLSWEVMLILLLLNIEHWFDHPFSLLQIISWLLLIMSIVLVLAAVYLLRKAGHPGGKHEDPSLLKFEKTTTLVTTGIYSYIRHPMYASLLYLAWGTYLKEVSWLSTILVLLATLFLIFTGKMEEKEDLQFFGPPYHDYMRRTKMFLPFIF